MVKRYVFKLFASVGPGGSWASLIEQVCTSVYPRAYTVGDEEDLETFIDKDIKALREEFVAEMFEVKEEFDEKGFSEDETTREEGYQILIEFLVKYIKKFIRLEKNKYMRERVYYQRSGQIALFEYANKQYNGVKKHVEDNIFRQAKSVFKPNPTDFDKYIKQFYDEKFIEDNEVYNVEEKISEFEARKYLEIWNNIKTSFAHEKQRLSQLRSTGGATPEDQAKMSKILDVEQPEQINLQKDLLFIETGEDVEDIFLAFKFYKLE